MTTGDLILAAIVVLTTAKNRAARAATPQKAADALDRIAKLQARANQEAARAWIPELVKAGASPFLAEALARWIGIESSGNPSKPSSAGEYGLLQILASTAKESSRVTARRTFMLRTACLPRRAEEHLLHLVRSDLANDFAYCAVHQN